ncbi:MAG: TatD family hydrolase [Bacteroidia bacterium]
MFINIHTHSELFDAKVEIVNLYPFDSPKPLYYSRGIHPWHIKNTIENELEQMQIVAEERRCIAIGECGLDKICAVDFELQKRIFEEQVHIANKVEKPLIIHCVKAFNELSVVLRKAQNKMPVIIHGYSNNLNIANALLKEGYFLSFGKGLLNESTQAAEVLRNTGKDKFFLETDDSTVSIKDIYQRASEILGVSEEIIGQQLKRNYQKTFKEEIL